jgi:cytochrome P450
MSSPRPSPLTSPAPLKLDTASSSSNEMKSSQRQTTNLCSRISAGAFGLFDRYILRSVYPATKDTPFREGFIGGDPYWGKLWELFREDGRGLDKIIEYASIRAEATRQGLAWWRFGPKKTVVLVTRPTDIEQLLSKENMKNLVMHDSTGQFKVFFGPHSIFSSAYQSANWKRLRPRFLTALFIEAVLKDDFQPMQDIITQHLARIAETNSGTVDNLEEFANSITMDMIGKLKLGLAKISESSKRKVSAIISQTAIEVANPWQKLLADYIPLYRYLMPVYRYFSPSKLDNLLKAGYQLLRTEYLAPNRENILGTQNWLNPAGAGSKLDLMKQETIYDITQFLVAGHETTAKLVLLSLMLLGDTQHKPILEKLRAEIEAQKIPPSKWDRNTLNQLPYLEAIINEVLRLYPPIPDILFETSGGFTLAEGRVNASDTIIVSPRMTQRSKAIWGEDAHEFKPERFLGKKYSEYQFFPFGFTPRQCVGQRFSLQEAKLILARAVAEFDFSHELHHPFPFHQVFTMRMDLPEVKMQFQRRAAMSEKEEERKSTFGL